MTLEIIIQIILFGVALAMDAFTVSITDGLIYTDINRKKSFFIAGVFGFMQGFMPLIGFFAIELISLIFKGQSGDAQEIFKTVIAWVSFGLLLFIGGKMFIEGIIEVRKPQEEKKLKKFSVKEVLIMGVATAIDAMAVGISLHSGSLSNSVTIWLHVSIIMVITFVISLLGLFLGKQIVKLFKGKTEITVIIGGVILILLGVWVILSHFLIYKYCI